MLKRLTALIRCVVLMFAVYARIEAMKAANAERSLRGESPAYGAEAFNYEAVPLSGILTTSPPGSTRSCDCPDTQAAKTAKQRYRFAWKNNCKRLTLFDRECIVLARAQKNSVLIQFTDNGQREVVSRYALRKIDSGFRPPDSGLPSPSSNNRQIRFEFEE